MASITFAADESFKSEISKFQWINLSELIKRELIKRVALIEKLNSPEEQEFIRWSVDLGRRAKEGSFKRLLSELSPKEREKLLKIVPAHQREKYQ